jgi:hypothetical protein
VAAEVFAVSVMNWRRTCTHVVVWDGQREVCTRYRQESPRSSDSRVANPT